MIRVVVADDQPLIRAGLTTLLNSEADIEVCLLYTSDAADE